MHPPPPSALAFGATTNCDLCHTAMEMCPLTQPKVRATHTSCIKDLVFDESVVGLSPFPALLAFGLLALGLPSGGVALLGGNVQPP
jgi:hypothetical protein